MIVSRLEFNPECRRAVKDAKNWYPLHQTLVLVFGKGKERYLWTYDSKSALELPVVYVQSHTTPCWYKVEKKYPGYFKCLDTRPHRLLENVQPGAFYDFKLTACPTKKNLFASRRESLLSPEDQLAWLNTKAQKSGFDLVNAGISNQRWLKHEKSGANDMIMISVTFRGILTVNDGKNFRESVMGGLGVRKAYGMGFLLFWPNMTHNGV